jgi:hypothetical protein
MEKPSVSTHATVTSCGIWTTNTPLEAANRLLLVDEAAEKSVQRLFGLTAVVKHNPSEVFRFVVQQIQVIPIHRNPSFVKHGRLDL